MSSDDREQQELMKTISNYTNKVKEVDLGKRDEILVYFPAISKSRLLDTCLDLVELNEKLTTQQKKDTHTQEIGALNVGVSLNLVVDVLYQFSFSKPFRGRMMQLNVIQKLSSLIV